MKKLCACIIALAFVFSVASAEIDLSGMSYEELLALKEQVNLALYECEEFQEVIVPPGVYEVGVDIPEGKWEICASDGLWSGVNLGTKKTKEGNGAKSDVLYEVVTSETSEAYALDNSVFNHSSVVVELKSGLYLEIEDFPVIFKSFTSYDLGFKFN